MTARRPRTVLVRAFAKINLTLRVLGRRDDGYHDLRTTFQAVALHDTLSFSAARGPFRIECDSPACPAGRSNLVWRAGASLWHAAGRRGAPTGVHVRIQKRIPVQAGLGGGTSDAIAALRALALLWRVHVTDDRLVRIAAELGADGPFFLQGGTTLGVERGDVLFPLADSPAFWVVVAVPTFGVSTADAYGWFDMALRVSRRSRSGPAGLAIPDSEWRNDLEGPVVGRWPEIGRLIRVLERTGALYAAMSGSGSAVYGLFDSPSLADEAARRLRDRSPAPAFVAVTRTLNRSAYQALVRPELAGRTVHRIDFPFAPRGSGHS